VGLKEIQEAYEKKNKELAEIKPLFELKTLDDVKQESVISYCLDRLKAGATYQELRRELGLGPSFQDKKWRKLREILVEYILPKTEEDALLQANEDASFWQRQLEGMVEQIDSKIEEVQKIGRIFDENTGKWKLADSAMLSGLLKTKLDAIKTIIDTKKQSFTDFMEIQKLRKSEKGTRGVSITIVNNIPRPERTVKSEVIDIAKDAK
jgi:hypothetical protein